MQLQGKKQPISEDVQEITYHKLLPLVFHGYVWPFVLAYSLILGGWIWIYGLWEQMEGFFICCAIVGSLNIIACLFCVWSVQVACKLTCLKVNNIANATMVKVVPTQNNGATKLVNISRDKLKVTGEEFVWFNFQKTKYVYDQKEGRFKAVQFPVDRIYYHYFSSKGYISDSDIASAKQLYGNNRLDVMSPDFWSLFKERATAPFFVFQVFCVGLWCLDEYWYYSIFTLFMLVTFEAVLVKQQQRNLSEVKKMGAKPFHIQVYRNSKWSKMSTENLLPGDIVSIGRSRDDCLVPCDLLLIHGSCIVDEAMLTGESVPQMKEPLDPTSVEELLDLSRDSRLHVLSGGTKVVQHSPPDKRSSDIRAPDGGCIGYVLRTGFNTSQGKLLRTILYGVKRVTANNLESLFFILFLLIFAIVAAVYVWVKGTEDPDRNRYKLFLECTLILTSVVPPELPIELSLAVNSSLAALIKLGIYCTEPFRIPFGGKVDVCCFDKTGTLTSDNLVIEGVAGLPSTDSAKEWATGSSKSKVPMTPLQLTPFETQCVLASCHSLALLEGERVGDPMEKATLKTLDWNFAKDTVSPRRGRKATLKICNRFHFSSALKRMSCIVALQSGSVSGPSYLVTAKGAPEVLQEMFKEVPKNYMAVHTKLARHGARVLALGYRDLGNLSYKDLYDLKRHEVECGLTFGGFLVISCPLKHDSKQNIQCLLNSSHYVTMLTGDSPLTACHVAKELKICQNKQVILTLQDSALDTWAWQKVGGGQLFPLSDWVSLKSQYDLCLTGDGLSHVIKSLNSQLLSKLLPEVKVFARVSPKQKEVVVTTFKSLGYRTLMCGDGTNDVGALKHAHVGVALLSKIPMGKALTEKALSDSSSVDTPTKEKQLSRPRKGSPVPKAPLPKPLTVQEQREKRLKDLVKKMEEEMEPQIVRLGDASIASPFTYKKTSIVCICHVIKQGRCTLVTTLQMYKILALNALILAYSQSVLYLDGIKFSDVQATIQGFLLAGCFLFISRSQPLKDLSKERPLPNIFNVYTILTVVAQFFVHFASLVYLVSETKVMINHNHEKVDLEKDFEKNELNSAVYLISMAMQISNFAVNYKGHPFMASLTENRPLLYSLAASASVIAVLASGLFPEVSEWFEVTVFPDDFRYKLLVVLLADGLASLILDRILSYFLGVSKPRLPVNCKHPAHHVEDTD